MLFWIVAALLTLAASLAVLVPLARRGTEADDRAAHDLEVYRDQLQEVERDAGRGMIGLEEAEEARAEIGRRMLRIGQAADVATVAERPFVRWVAGAAVLSVALVSWVVYGATGSPQVNDQPLAARMATNPADDPVQTLVAKAEAYLSNNPQDGRGWDVLAPIYLRVDRPADAVHAYREAIRLEGSSAKRQAGLGEALLTVANGLVTQEAVGAFQAALTEDPSQPNALFYLATADAQEGRFAEAAAAWQAMQAGLAADSPWQEPVSAALAEARRRMAAAPGTEPAPGPSQEQAEAAAAMPDADRKAMIETMVAGLDQRLRDNPNDPEGWIRLIRSYIVLQRTDDARAALKRGIEALGPDKPEGERLAAFAHSMGLTATE